MPFDPLSIIIGAAIPSIGWFVKRRLSGEPDRERAALISSYAALATTLKANGLTFEEVENVGELLRQRKRQGARADVPLASSSQSNDGTGPYWTQSAINTRAFGASKVAAAELDAAVEELSSILTQSEREALGAVQDTWSVYRDGQAAWAAMSFAQGSMEPMVHSSEKESLTLQRLAQVRAAIDERRQRFS